MVKCWPADLAVLDLIPGGGKNIFKYKQCAYSLSVSHSNHPDVMKYKASI